MKPHSKLGISIAALFIIGCQGHDSSTPKQPTSAPLEQSVKNRKGVIGQVSKVKELLPDLANYVEFKKNLNARLITFKVPAELYTAELKVQYSLNAKGVHPQYIPLSTDSAIFQDGYYSISAIVHPWVKDFRVKELNLKAYSEDELIFEMEENLIPDIVLKEDFGKGKKYYTLSDLGLDSGTHKIDIFMMEQLTALRTNGASINLEINRAYFDRVDLETFSQEEVDSTPVGFLGKNGGDIRISAQYAKGLLKVYLRGKNGGEGIPADTQREVGDNGKDGKVGRSSQRCKSMGSNLDIPPDCYDICVESPIHSEDGKMGPKGHPANPGFRGGDSGKLTLYIENDLDLTVDILTLPGKGGYASAPGRGGKGGSPGRIIGHSDKFTEAACGKAQIGQNGAIGEKGDAAADGTDGLSEESIVTIKNRKQ